MDAETLYLVCPKICYVYSDLVASKLSQLGVENARNKVGRIGNLWIRCTRLKSTLDDYENSRRDACQFLASTGLGLPGYDPEERVSYIDDIKRARDQRDAAHYRFHLFTNLQTLVGALPTLYIAEEELLKEKERLIQIRLKGYRRHRALAKLKRKTLSNRHRL